jgi:flavin reductase (DIM6/NTAB) family NADH-FMN oxidoreductase RutF
VVKQAEPVAASRLDDVALRRAFGTFPSGVTAVCTLIDGRPIGIAASSFTSVSLDPPLVSVCVAETSSTWPLLRTSPVLGITVLAEHHGNLTLELAAKTEDRFAQVAWVANERGAVFVEGGPLWLSCRLSSELPAGDHTIALLEIEELTVFEGVAPLVFYASHFRRLG